MSGSSKLHQPESDIPYAQVLPLKPEDEPPTAYAVNYKPYHDVESQTKPSEPIAAVVGEATVLENLGWDPETRKMFIRKVYSILTVQLLLTGGVSAFMTLHLPTQMYVLTHGWPTILSIVLSFGLLLACMCYKVCFPLNQWTRAVIIC
jgi:hypothetical protein